MKEIIRKQLFNYPIRSLFITLVLSLTALYGVLSVRLDFGAKIWFPSESTLIKDFNEFTSTFGSENYLFIGMSPPNKQHVFTNKTIQHIHNITDDILSLKQVLRVDSLANFTDIYYKDNDAKVAPFLEEVDHNYSKHDLKNLKARAIKHNILKGKYISDDATNTLFLVRLGKPLKDQITYKEVLFNIEKVIKNYESKGYTFKFVGTPYVVNEFRRICERDFLIIIPLLSVIVCIFIYALFRSFFAIFCVFTVIILTNITTISISGYLGMKLNNLSSMVPGVLMAICIADTIHFLSSFYIYDGNINNRLKHAFDKNFKGTLLTTLTTTIGFMSLATSTLIPIKDFGILCAIGTSLAWIYTVAIIFPMALISQNRLQKKKSIPSFAKFNYAGLSKFCIKYSKLIVISFTGLATIFLYLSTKNQVNSNPFEYINKNLKVYKDNQFFNKKYGGFSSFEMSIDSMKQDEVYSPLFLNKVNELQSWIKKDLKASYVGSIVDYQLLLNKTFHKNKEEEFKIPTTRKKSAELLTYYQMNLLPGQELNTAMTIDNRKMRSSVFWNTQNSKEYINKIQSIYNKAKQLGLNLKITGREYLFNRMNEHVVNSFFKSIILTIIGISIFLVIIFKSVKYGLISLFPNLFPILFGSAFMSLLEKPLDVGTVLVASVCFGIAVDDTIHFLLDVQKRIKKDQSMEEAFTNTFTNTGTALLSTTVILVCSFTVFLIADFVPNHNFGFFSALILTAALITDFLFLPALISLFTGKKRG